MCEYFNGTEIKEGDKIRHVFYNRDPVNFPDGIVLFVEKYNQLCVIWGNGEIHTNIPFDMHSKVLPL